MANEEHLAILRQGIDVWNAWRRDEAEIKPNLAYTDLRGCNIDIPPLNLADFSHTDLEGTDLDQADLESANLRYANLVSTALNYTDLSHANLSCADLRDAEISHTNFSFANLSFANLSYLDLTGANFSNANLGCANLIHTDLSYSDLSGLNLSGADLSGAELVRTRALATNFSKAIFTGACLADWHINSSTNLEEVNCDYVFLGVSPEERRPSNPNQNFAQGEFTKLFQKALNTVDLIFQNGVDWNALLTSLDKLRIEAEGSELSIQSIENKNDGAFVVRVNVPPQGNKAEVEKFIKYEYDLALKALDEKYKYQLQAKEREIEIYRQQSASIIELAKLMASRPINVEAKATAENQVMSRDRHINTGGGNYIESNTGTYIHGNYISMSQDLTQSAAQIQGLLEQLQSQGMVTEDAQVRVAEDMATQAKQNPDIKAKLSKWGQSLCDATVSDVVKGVVKLAIRSAGVPLP